MMTFLASGRSGFRIANDRRGLAVWPILGVLTGCAALIAGGLWVVGALSGSSSAEELLTQRAKTGIFTHDVVERGELESSANTTVRCEVQSRTAGSNGVKIIEIVPEGAIVKQGDFLVKFDDAALQAERTTQLINVSTAEAAQAQSKNELEANIIARKEYEFGEFESEKEKLNGEILVANEMSNRAAETVIFSEKLAKRGYLSRSKLRSDQYDLAKAKSDLKVASTKLHSLVEYTRQKKISELDSKVKTSEAKLKADEAKMVLEKQKLDVLDTQITHCTITAPVAGQVVYDHEGDNWRGAEYQIKTGTVVHEQRAIIRLPDPKKMQIKAKVAESRIDLIKPGMPAKIEIEGLPGVELAGKVTKVNEYPAPDNWFNANVKEYESTVEVIDPPSGLRPGMTAKVAIRVETIADALQVPIQAVIERGGKHYCLLVKSGSALASREVLIGSTNEKFIVVRDGLTANDEVLMNPRVHLASVNLPEAAPAPEPKKEPKVAERPTPDPAAAPTPGQTQASLPRVGT